MGLEGDNRVFLVCLVLQHRQPWNVKSYLCVDFILLLNYGKEIEGEGKLFKDYIMIKFEVLT